MIEETARDQEQAQRYLPMPAAGELALDAVLDAFADPVRLEIVRELAAIDECPCGALTVPVAESTRSHHLRTLREAGITRTRVAGTQRLVSLRRDALDARFPGLLAAVVAAASGPSGAPPG
jgi:DNA-binding transcriptional ArsR family regulator